MTARKDGQLTIIMAKVIIPEISGGYKADWNAKKEFYGRRLTGIHRNEVIIAKGNKFEGIEADE